MYCGKGERRETKQVKKMGFWKLDEKWHNEFGVWSLELKCIWVRFNKEEAKSFFLIGGVFLLVGRTWESHYSSPPISSNNFSQVWVCFLFPSLPHIHFKPFFPLPRSSGYPFRHTEVFYKYNSLQFILNTSN